MPDRGRLGRGCVAALRFELRGATAIWPDARWLQFTFEIPAATALAWLPANVTRPIPGYARILMVDANGDGGFAFLLVGGRLRALPVNVLAASLGGRQHDGPLHRDLETTFETDLDGRVLGQLAGASGPILTVTIPPAAPIDPGLLRWDPCLVASSAGTGELVEISVAPTARTAWRTKSADLKLAEDFPPDSPWRAIQSAGAISVCYCEGTFTMAVEKEIPGER